MTKKEIIDYLMTTPHNTNINVLKTLLKDINNRDAIIKYVFDTPYNMNRKVLEGLLGKDIDINNAIVGTAIVGSAMVK